MEGSYVRRTGKRHHSNGSRIVWFVDSSMVVLCTCWGSEGHTDILLCMVCAVDKRQEEAEKQDILGTVLSPPLPLSQFLFLVSLGSYDSSLAQIIETRILHRCVKTQKAENAF